MAMVGHCRLLLGGGTSLALVTQGVLQLEPWYLPSFMIPVVNALLAVGLISLPGMMTGQILSGVSPLIAVRYQIMVMCMIFGAAGLSTICFLVLVRKTKLFRNY